MQSPGPYTTSNTFLDLRNGDSMGQEEFHRTYQRSPRDFRAELIDGLVFVREPLTELHADTSVRLGSIFDAYRADTSGVQVFSEVSVILGQKDEVQPDLVLRILPAYQGQTEDHWNKTGKVKGPYMKGGPELVAEIAYSSRSMDLHIKRHRYEAAGVLEYLVVCLNTKKIYWFDLKKGKELIRQNGIIRSKIFPGLWIHEAALFDMDYKLSMSTLQKGLASAEHKAFIAMLKSKKQIEYTGK